jgi:hypothetical protein
MHYSPHSTEHVAGPQCSASVSDSQPIVTQTRILYLNSSDGKFYIHVLLRRRSYAATKVLSPFRMGVTRPFTRRFLQEGAMMALVAVALGY